MPKWLKITLSGLIAGLIAALTALIALWSELPTDAPMTDLWGVGAVIAIAGGVLAALKDWYVYLSPPPV